MTLTPLIVTPLIGLKSHLDRLNGQMIKRDCKDTIYLLGRSLES